MPGINRRSFLTSLGLGLLGAAALPAEFAQAETTETGPQVKIHFVVPDSIWRNQDAIIIEIIDEDGEKTYGLIDGGFGSTWSTSDPSYVNRYKENNKYNPNTLADCYLKTLSYLESLDITTENVAFYLGTHAHSDHIGLSKEIITTYLPKVVYTPEYSDDYLKPGTQVYTNIDGESFNGNNLSDNQYYYDRLVDAAHEIDVPLVTTLDPDGDEPSLDSDTAKPTFTVAGVEFEIMNYDTWYRDLQGSWRVDNCNDFSWGLKFTAHGRTGFLAADINNTWGTEDILAEELGKVDFLKLGHHGSSGSNTYNYLATLSPELVVQTGSCSNGTPEKLGTLDTVAQSRWFATQDGEVLDLDAIVVTIAEDGEMTTNVDGLWMPRYTVVGAVLYENGRPVSSGWHHVDNKWYWTDGANFYTGWVEIDGVDYHFEPDGTLTTGWIERDGQYFYMMEDGHWAPPGFMAPGGPGGFFGANGPAGPGGPSMSPDQAGFPGPFSPEDTPEYDDPADDADLSTYTSSNKKRIGGWNNLDPDVKEPTTLSKLSFDDLIE